MSTTVSQCEIYDSHYCILCQYIIRLYHCILLTVAIVNIYLR